ncbi:uncharacterized protein LOC128350481 [Hemicordylus capensis]|uniref:uncharacterized protein LOC128350481 n=1 Tax=Hemicordylus capensis TaxID=884348 RepID=UPI0023028DBF|nr:uncharacterized protein LOC128350481 [Hemicordylus capensis]
MTGKSKRQCKRHLREMERPTKQQIQKIETQEILTDDYAMADFSLPPLRPPGKPSSVVNVHLPKVKISTRQTAASSSNIVTSSFHPIRSPNKHISSPSPMTNPAFLPPLNLSSKKIGKNNALPPLNAAVKQTEATQEEFYLQMNKAIQELLFLAAISNSGLLIYPPSLPAVNTTGIQLTAAGRGRRKDKRTRWKKEQLLSLCISRQFKGIGSISESQPGSPPAMYGGQPINTLKKTARE